MNPLAAYMLSVLKRERTNDTRTYQDYENALIEMGYWLLERPVNYTRKQMPLCKISEECTFMEEFKTYCPSLNGYESFDVIVEVWADSEED